MGTAEQEYASLSELLVQFTEIPTVEKTWSFHSENGEDSQVMFLISQPSLLANKKRKSLLSGRLVKDYSKAVKFHRAPFPIEMTGVSAICPSPSGSKLLVVRNSEGDSPACFEIWGPSSVKKEFVIPCSLHGSLYIDGWFEAISWSPSENAIAYIAEEPDSSKPKFDNFGYRNEGTADKDFGSWKGQGDWEEDWGEAYAGKRQPSCFVLDIDSGVVSPVVVGHSLSVGQVVWAPSLEGQEYLVFVGWPSQRKLGIKYCYNRHCALYAVKAPLLKSEEILAKGTVDQDLSVFNLTPSISSAFFPRFSPDGKFLVFLSCKSAVDSGAHMATDSLHKIDWPSSGKLDVCLELEIFDVVPVVMCPEDCCFPGIYCSKILAAPWLSDGQTMVFSSIWDSAQTLLTVNILSGKVSRITLNSSNSSWDVLALVGDEIIAECSSPVDIPQIKYGSFVGSIPTDARWTLLDVLSPITKYSERVISSLASLRYSILKIPVRHISENLTKAIYVSSTSNKSNIHDPLIVILHGGPHDVSVSSFSKTSAFLCAIGFSLLIVNYRGSWGFGEEALQSLPGKVGSQDVDDVLTAIDHVIDKGLADPSKMAVVGISHGGFLATHLIGQSEICIYAYQAPEKFAAAAARNPVCNFALLVGTTDIPDWCFVNVYGNEGKSCFTESPSVEDLTMFYRKSPISHVSKVKTPTLFLLGARDVRVPLYDGKQYARALREKGVETKVIVFPNDIHPINRPQSEFESFLEIGLWFNKYCK